LEEVTGCFVFGVLFRVTACCVWPRSDRCCGET